MEILTESPRQMRRRLAAEAKQAENQELSELIKVQNRAGSLQNSIVLLSATLADLETQAEVVSRWKELKEYRRELNELKIRHAELSEARKHRASVGRLEAPTPFRL